MIDRLYILAIDANSSVADLERIRHYVTTSGDFNSWWNHIAMVFILETTLDSDSIGERLHGLAPQVRFLVTEANITKSQGWLPEVSWKWIEKRALSPAPEMNSRL